MAQEEVAKDDRKTNEHSPKHKNFVERDDLNKVFKKRYKDKYDALEK